MDLGCFGLVGPGLCFGFFLVLVVAAVSLLVGFVFFSFFCFFGLGLRAVGGPPTLHGPKLEYAKPPTETTGMRETNDKTDRTCRVGNK